MRLHRMDDVAGCRLIFRDIDALYEFRQAFHAARFKHELRNEPDRYDYIKSPKPDGYRGIHDVYKYDVRSHYGEAFKGLQIELQYRTIFQHAWATCVEVVGLVTTSNPKFKSGDKRYETIMMYASEMLARVWENRMGPCSNLSAHDLIEHFYELDRELNFLDMLRALDSVDDVSMGRRNNIILIFSSNAPLEVRTYKDAFEAIVALFELENSAESAEKDIVLVRGNRKDVRNAFRNYFRDAKDFVAYMDIALLELAAVKAGEAMHVPYQGPGKVSDHNP